MSVDDNGGGPPASILANPPVSDIVIAARTFTQAGGMYAQKRFYGPGYPFDHLWGAGAGQQPHRRRFWQFLLPRRVDSAGSVGAGSPAHDQRWLRRGIQRPWRVQTQRRLAGQVR